MKRILLIIIIPFIFFIYPVKTVTAQDKEPECHLMHDTLVYTLAPYIKEEIVRYYGYRKQFALYNAKIINIKKEYTGYKVTIMVNTFEHAHNPPYGKETITFLISSSKVEVIDYQHEGDKYEKLIKEFYDETIEDIIKSFNLDVNSHDKYTMKELLYKSEKAGHLKPLRDIVVNIIKNILHPDIKYPKKNVIDPVTFIKGNSAYILFKRADGTNNLYKLTYDYNKWIIEDKQNKKGKIMESKLLWYM